MIEGPMKSEAGLRRDHGIPEHSLLDILWQSATDYWPAFVSLQRMCCHGDGNYDNERKGPTSGQPFWNSPRATLTAGSQEVEVGCGRVREEGLEARLTKTILEVVHEDVIHSVSSTNDNCSNQLNRIIYISVAKKFCSVNHLNKPIRLPLALK